MIRAFNVFKFQILNSSSKSILKKLCTIEGLRLFSVIIIGFQITKHFLNVIYHYDIARHFVKPINFTELGQWAVITGSANRIGRAFVEVFAKEGINIVLIDRNLESLEEEARDLEKEYGIETIVIQTDYENNPEVYLNIQTHLRDLNIGILVNNVHEHYPHPDFLLDLKDPLETVERLVDKNIFSYIYMIKLILPNMIVRRNGLIINVSSFTAEMPSPMLSVYAASKHFIEKFTDDLSLENEGKGVTFLCLLPGFLDSKHLRLRQPSLLAPSTTNYIQSALQQAGVHEKTVGYYAHTFFLNTVHLLYYIWPELGIRYTLRNMNFFREIMIRGHDII